MKNKKLLFLILSIVIIIPIFALMVTIGFLYFRANSNNTTISAEVQDILNNSETDEGQAEEISESKDQEISYEEMAGTYRLEENLTPEAPGTGTETEYNLIEITVDNDGNLEGSHLNKSHFDFETKPDIIDTEYSYNLSGKLDGNKFAQKVEYIDNVDNNVEEPLHREFELTAEVTIVFSETGAKMTKVVTCSTGIETEYSYDL